MFATLSSNYGGINLYKYILFVINNINARIFNRKISRLNIKY